MFISFLCMFRATMCSSSGEITVYMRHWYLSLFVDDCLVCRMEWNSTLHIRQSSTQSDKYQVSHSNSYFSWWWAHSRPKHVGKRNKHTKKNCAQVGFIYKIIQGYTIKNIKFNYLHICLPSIYVPLGFSAKILFSIILGKFFLNSCTIRLWSIF